MFFNPPPLLIEVDVDIILTDGVKKYYEHRNITAYRIKKYPLSRM